MSEVDHEFNNLIFKLAEKIEELTFFNCVGCQEHISSFKHHLCYSSSWYCKILQFFDLAIQDFPESENYSIDEILKALCNYYGSSNDFQTESKCNVSNWK
jgi:hypothetical protein